MVAAQRLEGHDLFVHPLTRATMAVLHERGYQQARIEEFFARAGVGRGDFDSQFCDKAELVLCVMEAFIDDFLTRLLAAYASAPTWPESLRAAAYEVTRWMRDNPDCAWWGMVGVLEAPDMALVRREDVFKRCAELIDTGRAVAPDPRAVPRSAPLIAVGAIVETVRRYEEGTVIVDPVATVPQLMYAAVRPYLGEEAARRELDIPPPSDLAAAE